MPLPLRRAALLTAAPLALASLAAAAPRPAAACGGTFCDAGPQVMPVDQRGESILFVMEEGFVEAHVQIEYEGDPAQFAWIVPLMLPAGTEPEISVGSDALFQRLLAGTVPTFTLDTAFEGDCDDGPRGGGLGCGRFSVDAAQSLADGEGISNDDAPPGAPTVVARDVAGAYEYAVLAGGTIDGIGQWLDDNGYARDDDAPEILQAYLDDGFAFVAFKLQAGTDLDQIHPVVIRYQGVEPCVPLRLTRIAAVEDMPVRAFFLGDARVVPTNYRHVELNPLRIDWLNLASNYDELVSEAVDAEGADGRAFLTQYAGPSTVVERAGLRGLPWDSEAYLDVTAANLTSTLEAQGLYACGSDSDTGGFEEACGLTHPLVLGLLRTHFPPPPDVAADVFFACTSCYPEVDTSAWDHAGFAAAFEEQVVAPAEHAADVLDDNPYLTRLYTVISPGEMTSDPLFHARPELPEVSNQFRATRVFHCEENDRIDLADGTSIYLDESNALPDFSELSAAVRVEEVPVAGASMVLLDTATDDAAVLADWNAAQNPRAGCECQATRRQLHGASWLGLLVLLGLRARGRSRSRQRSTNS